MRQILMLGFYCEVYRREPRCRVYANDVLVDEFNILNAPCKKKTLTLYMKLDPKFWSEEELDLKLNTPFLKLIELDDASGKSLDIRVEIQNNDNNYANGFMTQQTRVMLCQFWLAPIKLWEEFDQIRDRWKFSKHNCHKWHDSTNALQRYQIGSRNYAFDNFAEYANMHFPDITQQPQSKQKQKFFANHQYLPQISQKNVRIYWTGTSGFFHLNLVKKLGFWRLSTDRRRGWWKWSMIRNAKDLYDKYRYYENTRITDQ